MPLVWTLRRRGFSEQGRVYGPDLMELALPYGLEHGWKHFFFGANDGGPEGWEIFKSDGTAAGTVRVTDIPTPTAGTFPSGLTPVGDRLVFLIRTPTAGTEPWTTDGTATGTPPAIFTISE